MVTADRLSPQRPVTATTTTTEGRPLLEKTPSTAVVRRLVVDSGDDFLRAAARRAPTPARGSLPVVSPVVDGALRSELAHRTAGAPNSDMLRAAGLRPFPDPLFPTAPEGLSVGDTGKAVKRAERQLAKAGFDVGKVDGVFDAQTARAVKKFQAATQDPGAVASGVVDARTQKRLDGVTDRIKDYDDRRLGPGQQGRRVLTVERQLDKLGYDVGKVDGTYDRATGDAIKQFRQDQGWKTLGRVMGQRAENALEAETKAFSHDPERRRVKASAARERMDERVATAAAKTHADGTVGIGEGSTRSNVVKAVQQHLRAAGYDPQHVDGKFDERTRGALEQFQRRSDLPVTGRVDESTWKALKKSTIEAQDGYSPAQHEGERSGAVRRTEKMLEKLGYDPGKIDGLYDARTQKAVDRFRAKKGLGDGGVGPRVHDAMVDALKEKREGSTTALGKRLAANARSVALSMGGYSSQSYCARGVSRAIEKTMGIKVWGNGNQIDNNLPRDRFRELHIPLEKALKIPGLVLTWERTSSAAGSIYGHTAITSGDGRSSMSDFIETNTLGASGRSGLRVFMPVR